MAMSLRFSKLTTVFIDNETSPEPVVTKFWITELKPIKNYYTKETIAILEQQETKGIPKPI